MVSWSNLEKLCSCSRTWMVSALACGNKWIQVGTYIFDVVKGIFSDSNNIFLWYESDDINKKKSLFPKFQLIPILHF